jgi:hypothetical protein
VPGDVEAAGDPDVGVFPDMVEQALQAVGAGRVADQAHMQADRHHLGLHGARRQASLKAPFRECGR